MLDAPEHGREVFGQVVVARDFGSAWDDLRIVLAIARAGWSDGFFVVPGLRPANGKANGAAILEEAPAARGCAASGRCAADRSGSRSCTRSTAASAMKTRHGDAGIVRCVTAGWETSADSTSVVEMLCPATSMMSSTRPSRASGI